MLKDTVLELLPAHSLSRCDTVPMCYGIGKSKVLKIVNCKVDKCSLSVLGDEGANIDDIIKQATAFMCKCYNVANGSTTEARIRVWTAKTGRKAAAIIAKLCSLPPTSEAFLENVKRAHFQCAIWRRALQEPPDLDPTTFGWV